MGRPERLTPERQERFLKAIRTGAFPEAVWDRFTVPKKDTLWYYRTLVKTCRHNPAHNAALVEELARTVRKMRRLAKVD
jgi:hypothetical protein